MQEGNSTTLSGIKKIRHYQRFRKLTRLRKYGFGIARKQQTEKSARQNVTETIVERSVVKRSVVERSVVERRRFKRQNGYMNGCLYKRWDIYKI